MQRLPLASAASILTGLLLTLTVFQTMQPANALAGRVTQLPPVVPGQVGGDIRIAASGMANPLTAKIAQQFKSAGFRSKIAVESVDNDDDISRICNGEIDLVYASYLPVPEDIEACNKNGHDLIQFNAGMDVLVVAVSRQNRFVNSLTRDQLAQAFSGKVTMWKGLNPQWPAQKIILFSPAETHDVYRFFSTKVFEDSANDGGFVVTTTIIAQAPGIQLKDSFGDVAKGVQSSVFAIGYFDYAFYAGNRARLRMVPYEGVMANDRTLPRNEYEFSRPLFIISSVKTIKDKPQVAAFINYYLTNVNAVSSDIGYFPQPEAALEEARQLWLQVQE